MNDPGRRAAGNPTSFPGSSAAIGPMLGFFDASAASKAMLRNVTPALSSFAAATSKLSTADTDALFTAIVAELDKVPSDIADSREASLDLNGNAEKAGLSKEARCTVAAYVAVLFLSVCAYLYLAYPTVMKLIIDASAPVTWAIALAKLVYEQTGEKRD